MITTIYFYRGNSLVRTEVCSNEFEAEEIVKLEKNMYDSYKFVYNTANTDAVR
jgi:hypothetical protein